MGSTNNVASTPLQVPRNVGPLTNPSREDSALSDYASEAGIGIIPDAPCDISDYTPTGLFTNGSAGSENRSLGNPLGLSHTLPWSEGAATLGACMQANVASGNRSIVAIANGMRVPQNEPSETPVPDACGIVQLLVNDMADEIATGANDDGNGTIVNLTLQAKSTESITTVSTTKRSSSQKQNSMS